MCIRDRQRDNPVVPLVQRVMCPDQPGRSSALSRVSSPSFLAYVCNAVSYTHLDVYKRQALLRAPWVDSRYQASDRISFQQLGAAFFSVAAKPMSWPTFSNRSLVPVTILLAVRVSSRAASAPCSARRLEGINAPVSLSSLPMQTLSLIHI